MLPTLTLDAGLAIRGAPLRPLRIARASRTGWRTAGLALLCAVLATAGAGAQELEPRAYASAPVGANFLVGLYSHSTGNVVFDPTLPVTDVHAVVQGLVIAAGHSFSMFGDQALVTATLPAAWAHVTGNVQEQRAEVNRSGLADTRFKLSVNFRGNPAMSPREFASAPRRTIVGASVAVTAPSGQYYDTKLINLGTNRWSVKPEVGISVPKGHWYVDGYVGAYFYATNSDFYPDGRTRTQDPLLAIQLHGSYTFRPRLWLAVDGTWYHGGSAQVDAGPPSTSMNNSRIGATLSVPVAGRYSVKVAYANGVVARTGTDFSTVAIAWQALWLSPRWAGR